MIGDVGPYVEMDGPRIWVPRTVPYLEARRIAATAGLERWQRLRYTGKEEGRLFGFVRDCRCEEVCELSRREDPETYEMVDSGDRTCMVPVWAFEVVEP